MFVEPKGNHEHVGDQDRPITIVHCDDEGNGYSRNRGIAAFANLFVFRRYSSRSDLNSLNGIQRDWLPY